MWIAMFIVYRSNMGLLASSVVGIGAAFLCFSLIHNTCDWIPLFFTKLEHVGVKWTKIKKSLETSDRAGSWEKAFAKIFPRFETRGAKQTDKENPSITEHIRNGILMIKILLKSGWCSQHNMLVFIDFTQENNDHSWHQNFCFWFWIPWNVFLPKCWMVSDRRLFRIPCWPNFAPIAFFATFQTMPSWFFFSLIVFNIFKDWHTHDHPANHL